MSTVQHVFLYFFAPVMQDQVDEINARDLPVEESAEEEEEQQLEEANAHNEEDSNYSTALYNLFCHHLLQAFNFWGFCHHSHLFLLPSFQDVAEEGEEDEDEHEDDEVVDPCATGNGNDEDEEGGGSGITAGSSTDRVEQVVEHSPSATRTELDDENDEVDEKVVTPTNARVSTADELYERYGLICSNIDTPLERILPDNQLGMESPNENQPENVIEDIDVPNQNHDDDGEKWEGPPLHRCLALETIDVDSLENGENDGSASHSGPNHTVLINSTL